MRTYEDIASVCPGNTGIFSYLLAPSKRLVVRADHHFAMLCEESVQQSRLACERGHHRGSRLLRAMYTFCKATLLCGGIVSVACDAPTREHGFFDVKGEERRIDILHVTDVL